MNSLDELNKRQVFSVEVTRAQTLGLSVVALESAVITHGLPRSQNLTVAQDMEQAVRAEGAVPATIAVLEGKIIVGLGHSELERLAYADGALKIGPRDFPTALVMQSTGGTTMAGTMFTAHRVGIKVLATGGIGGVHKTFIAGALNDLHLEQRFDVSADLTMLAETPMLVVCAGAKSVLDLPATLEYLETINVPVVGYQTDRFPEFFCSGGKLPVSVRLDNPADIVKFANYHWDMGMKSAVLVCQQIPSNAALDAAEFEAAEKKASQEALKQGVHGHSLTPFLLKRINELTGGKSMRANLALLLNNAKLAANIARAVTDFQHQQKVI
jgi:pseudouridylate synthase